eukprot:TRINITY_DN6269_c0_g1_i4.p1 TRINITY_DN6269_c0_g1~~TRINITY_DN6269_c0_g1_i4.p1  ORF type:complete len:265 (-),score=21.07 TRINITY_DN6269_c0_g1_i4:68-862(-)
MLKSLLLVFTLFALSAIAAKPVLSQQDRCLMSCKANYTKLGDRPSKCCDCCGVEQCAERPLQSMCCSAGQDFCGCNSDTKRCNGHIFSPKRAVISSPYGSCYSRSGEICASSRNQWIICPRNTMPCVGKHYSTCCATGEVCTSSSNASLPICSGAEVAVAEAMKCGSRLYCHANEQCCDDDSKGKLCYNPTSFSCTTNTDGKQILCPMGQKSCGSKCFQDTKFTCVFNEKGKSRLCPIGQLACGDACFDPKDYACRLGGLASLA